MTGQRVLDGLDAALDGGAETWSDEYRFLHSDGNYRVVLDRGWVVRDEAGGRRACWARCWT